MRPKTLILFFVAIGCGLVASIGVSQYMEKARTTGGVKLETQKIYVAAAEINIGDKLDDKNIKLEEWPKDRVPDGVVVELKELEGKYPRMRLYKGEPVLAAKLSNEISANVTQKIREGYRVVTVKVNSESNAGGLIRPGDHVDLLVFLRKSAEVPETTTRTILTDVDVFACDAETERTVDKGTGQAREVRTVSLLVKPNQAETVTLAKELGTMSLTLRRPGDLNDESGGRISVHELLGSTGESGTDPKPRKSSEGSGLAKWLNHATQPPVQEAPPEVPVEQPVEAPAPAPVPVQVVVVQEPPKFVMKIRTPNGDRSYRWKDLEGEPEEAGEVAAHRAPASNQPTSSPSASSTPVEPATTPIRATAAPAPNRQNGLRTNTNAHDVKSGTQGRESDDSDADGSGLNEKQDN